MGHIEEILRCVDEDLLGFWTKDYPKYHYLIGAVLKEGAPKEAIEEARKQDAIDLKYEGEHSFMMFVPDADLPRWIAMRKKQAKEDKEHFEEMVEKYGIC